MIVSIRKWIGRILFLLLFSMLLIIVTVGYRWLVEVVSPIHPYKKPEGHAMKVFDVDPEFPEGGNAADRLRWFYWYGE
ncbi:DUF4227 family protein [Paenibacillus chungangensis]|uniref:DUF4227 family protein n=1 Tax=Paenibacillus chungangensis TaxID=696535 RepID=A0ABW3HMK4_9BACL